MSWRSARTRAGTTASPRDGCSGLPSTPAVMRSACTARGWCASVEPAGWGRGRRICERIARRTPAAPDVLEVDVNDRAALAAVAQELEGRWGRVDGVLHAIAFVPPDALGGRFLTAPAESAITAFQ